MMYLVTHLEEVPVLLHHLRGGALLERQAQRAVDVNDLLQLDRDVVLVGAAACDTVKAVTMMLVSRVRIMVHE